MCPLIAAPNRGYADWQRIGNYDQDPTWTLSVGGTTLNKVSPVLDVSRYARLVGQFSIRANPVLVIINFYTDPAATNLVGQRIFTMQPTSDEGIVAWINLGPFCQITVQPILGAIYGLAVSLFGSNRETPSEFMPSSYSLVIVNSGALPASGSATAIPRSSYAGPVTVWLQAAQQSNVTLNALDSAGNFNPFQQLSKVPSNTNATVTTVVPMDAWRVTVGNETAVATTFFVGVIASPTGSS